MYYIIYFKFNLFEFQKIRILNSKKQQKWIKEITLYILSDVLSPDEREEILNIIENKEENDMDEWVKRVRRNNEKNEQKLIKTGKHQTLKNFIKNMLLNNEDEAKILQYTNLSQKEYQKIKKELKVES